MRLIDADKLTAILFPTPIFDSTLVRAGDIYRAIAITPTETRNAHWIKKVHEWDLGDPPSDYTDYTCSNCKIRVQDKTPFCPFCGAEMNEEEHQCQ